VITRFTKALALIAPLYFLPLSGFAQMGQDSLSKQTASIDLIERATIHQEVDFKASPKRVYEALLDSKQFSEFSAQSGEFSAASAKIDLTEGGAFTLFDGYVTGRNVELVQDRRIVQAWHDKDWPAGVYSLVKFELKSQGSGSHLVFDHTGFPLNSRKHLAAGWKSHYWDPITKYLR
jgi:activator of HSP90 ATPase